MPHKEICALVWWVQIWDLWFHPPCLCAKQKRWTDRLYMRGGGGVMVWGYFAGDTVGDLFKIEDTLNQHGYHSILQWHAILSGSCLVGPSFIFVQDNDPKHTSSLCKVYMTKKESDGVCVCIYIHLQSFYPWRLYRSLPISQQKITSSMIEVFIHTANSSWWCHIFYHRKLTVERSRVCPFGWLVYVTLSVVPPSPVFSLSPTWG